MQENDNISHMIGSEDIEKLAKLARIELTSLEKQSLANEVDTILAYVGQIQSIGSVETGTDVSHLQNVFREDENPHETGIFTDAILKAAPDREGSYIKVKKIL